LEGGNMHNNHILDFMNSSKKRFYKNVFYLLYYYKMKNFNYNIKSIFKSLSFNKNYKVICSSSSNLFFGDYDLNSLLNYKGKNPETTIYKNFKKNI
jgi:hypothetical protein